MEVWACQRYLQVQQTSLGPVCKGSKTGCQLREGFNSFISPMHHWFQHTTSQVLHIWHHWTCAFCLQCLGIRKCVLSGEVTEKSKVAAVLRVAQFVNRSQQGRCGYGWHFQLNPPGHLDGPVGKFQSEHYEGVVSGHKIIYCFMIVFFLNRQSISCITSRTSFLSLLLYVIHVIV